MGTGFTIPYPSTYKKFIPIPIAKLNEYQTFVPSSSLLGNEYTLVPILVLDFLLFQYLLINFYKIIENYDKGNIILSNIQY